jgi:hypothetical protein
VITTLLFFAVLQSGPSAGELLDRGEKALADLEYDLAAEELMRAATAADATPEQRLRAHLLAGTANRIAGHDVDAQINFRYVLSNAPGTKLPDGTPPKVLTFFEAVRQQLQAENRPAQPAPVAPAATAEPAAPVEPAPAAVTRAEPAPATSSGGAFPLGLAVAGGGAAVALLGGVGLIGAEVYLTDPAADGGTRGTVQTLGVISAGVLGVGVIAAAVGAGLWGSGALQ